MHPLRTERLRLREFRGDELSAMYAYRRDPRFGSLYPEDECTEAGTRTRLDEFILWQGDTPRINWQWAIEPLASVDVIGCCGIRRRTAGSRVADVGFELAPDCWGAGYATEAAARAVAFGFEDLGLHRIEAHCVRENAASAHVLEKLGMRREGLLREKEWFRGRWWDVSLYAVLAAEWASAGD
jgi:[ribosomal protein S5]-alanine N-acetyltransferase